MGETRAAPAGSTAPGRRTGAREPDLARDPDVQTLLASCVGRLAETTGCRRVAAWGRDVEERPAVLAARYETGSVLPPSESALRALGRLDAAVDLGAADASSALGALAREHGLAAAAPVHADRGETVAFLLLGGGEERPGRVRPRTLAVLGAAARRLALPLAGARATRRLAGLDAGVRRLDRLAALGELTAEIVHEIRNPLVSVKTFLQLLPDRVDDPEFRRSFFEVASEELRRVERLLDVVLEQARPSEPGPGSPSAAVGDALAAVGRLVAHRAAQREVVLYVEEGSGSARAAIGADELRQVVLNLVLNGLQATPAGGSVRACASPRADRVLVCVEDEGPGVRPDLRERIFEPFVSSRADGAGGLGLAITRRIVEEAGGTISVEELPGGGSRFRVELPAAPEQD